MWWRVLYLLVIFSWAESIDSTGVFDQACYLAHVVFTQFVIWALVISFTFNGLASNFVISWITMVASFTWAYWFMMLCSAFSISPTDNWTITCIQTFSLTHSIFSALFCVTTIIICSTSNFLHTNTILAELESWTAVIWLTSWLANTLNTELITDTFTGTGTLSCK